MAMQEVNKDGKLQEIRRAQGGDWGGIYVDEEFKEMLENILSKPVVEAFRMAHTMDYIDLFRNFERKKRQKQTSSNVTISVPATLPEIVDDINRHIEEQGLKEVVTWKKGKFQIKLTKYEEFFNNVIDKIVVKVEEMLVSDTAKGTNVIIMVGEFSGSDFLQQRIKDSFPSYTVVTPPECGLAVLKGAVLYGHDPDIIAAKIMKLTYGVGINTPFIEGIHPESKKRLMNGKEFCKDKFDIYVRIDTFVRRNEVKEKIYYPIFENQTAGKFQVFASEEKDPQYTDGCRERGTLTVPMPDISGGLNRKVVAKFKFGASTIKVKGIDETSKQSDKIRIDFLDV